MDDLLKTIRLIDDIKLEIYQQGKRRKYSIFSIPVNGIYSNDNYFKTSKYDISLNEDDIIDESIKQFSIYTKKDKEYYKILQNPWDNNSPSKRRYGSTLYYLNNNCSISIEWLENGSNKYSDNDDADSNIKKIVNIYLPNGFTENNGTGYLSVNKSCRLDYSTNVGSNYMEHFNQSDSDLVKFYISIFKTMVVNIHGDNDYDLKLCVDDTKSCSIIKYKSPIEIPKQATQPTITNISATSSNSKLTIIGLPEVITIKAKSDISFEVFIGDIIENYELEDEFIEGDFNGEEDNPSIIESWAPIDTIVDDEVDNDNKADGDLDYNISSNPATKNQMMFIKKAINATLLNGQSKGKCARFTFNHAKNYVRLLQGKDVESGAKNFAGGNAKDDGYHRNLISMGYKKFDKGTISKDSLISSISKSLWEVGDVIVYWCLDGNSDNSHVKYGHTQIFSNMSLGNFNWSTDDKDNYGKSFLYNSREGRSWRFLVFKAPKTKRIEQIV